LHLRELRKVRSDQRKLVPQCLPRSQQIIGADRLAGRLQCCSQTARDLSILLVEG